MEEPTGDMAPIPRFKVMIQVISRIFSASLFVLFVSFEHSHAAMIPVAEGNTWVYNHRFSRNISSPQSGTLDSNEGLFTMRIDSVIIRADTMVFNMTTIDSGVTSAGTPFNERSMNKYMKVQNGLFKLDTATDKLLPCSDPFILFIPHSDTSYSSYVVLRDDDHYKSDSSYSSSRHIDSLTVTINGTDERKLYIADTSFLRRANNWDKENGNTFSPYSTASGDTLQWLDGIGVISRSYRYDDGTLINTSAFNRSIFKETYTILSFNGNSVSIFPVDVIVKAGFSFADRTSAIRSRPVFRLGTALYRQTDPSRCFNLLGRKSIGVGSTQLLIIKEEIPNVKH